MPAHEMLSVYVIYNMYTRIKETVNSLQGRRAGISPNVDAFLSSHGDEPITQFVISRTILNPLLTNAIGVISPSFRRKTQNTPLYHLHVLLRTSKSSLSLEKTERITIGRHSNRPGSENMQVSVPSGLTLNIMLGRTRMLMGGKFLTYSAQSNNCQDFILAVVQSNNISTSANTLFVKQSTKSLFTPQLRKISNTLTDAAGVANILRQGGDIDRPKKINPWIQHVKIYASQKRIPFFVALKSTECKSSYQKKKL